MPSQSIRAAHGALVASVPPMMFGSMSSANRAVRTGVDFGRGAR
jgi:hypothetical protein